MDLMDAGGKLSGTRRFHHFQPLSNEKTATNDVTTVDAPARSFATFTRGFF
jgi:hypothetical protein